MYFSYSPSPPSTSYTMMPMDIPSKSTTTRPQSPASSCAFPSWPQRSSLSSEGKQEERVSSFISDDDLEDLFSCAFDHRQSTPLTTPSRTPLTHTPEAQVVVDTGAMMRQLIAEEKAKKERRARRRSSTSKKSRSGSNTSNRMSPICE